MRTRRWAMGIGIALGAAGAMGAQVFAEGAPTMQPLFYGGTLEDGGELAEGSYDITLTIHDAETAGNVICVSETDGVPVTAGRFRMDVSNCAGALHETADAWVSVSFTDETAVVRDIPGRAKIGAVPYALEAQHAVTASGAEGGLETRLSALVPPKGIVMAALTASDVSTEFDASGLGNEEGVYAGWAICNGNNGTPNLTNRFVRISSTAAGATGGSDGSAHTHSIDHNHGSASTASAGAHTHSTPNHQHVIPMGFDESWFYMAATSGGRPLYGNLLGTFPRATESHAAFASGAVRLAQTNDSGGGATGSGGNHSHSVDLPNHTGSSGAASATDNRPAYHELVALMRVSP